MDHIVIHTIHVAHLFHNSIISFHLMFQCNSFDVAIANVCEHALEKLNGILVHSDVTVLQAAADACKQLLESRMAVSLSSMSIKSRFHSLAVRILLNSTLQFYRQLSTSESV